MNQTSRGLRDIAGEIVLVAGGGRAILLQIAHPAVGRGVADHSDFASRPLDRLKATLTYVYAVVYGSPEEVAIVRQRVNRAHAPVHSAEEAGGHPYDAYDPQLQLWVAATLYETAVTMYQCVFGPLDEESAERIYQDYASIGTALQVPHEIWPADRHAFRRYWESMLPRLGADEATQRVANDLLHASNSPWWLRAAMPLGRLLTVGLLSPDLRSSFALPWPRRAQRRFDRWMRFTAAVYPRLPPRMRHRLRDHYLAELRADLHAAPCTASAKGTPSARGTPGTRGDTEQRQSFPF
ncbi:MAG: hypothetical protein QOF36_831 [Microbacteriaceae bacterium]|jgi:uncharacterized protein (DUF2236 family)|nr:hypothetical protein [Microbacteriaceae bacterium]